MSNIIHDIYNDIDAINNIANTRIKSIINNIESDPFALLHDICQYYYEENNSTHVIKNPKKYNDKQIILLRQINDQMQTKYAFGCKFTYDPCDITYVTSNVTSYVNKVLYNLYDNHNICLDNIASLTLEYIVYNYSQKNIMKYMHKYGWHMEIKDEVKKYNVRSYREGPMETIEEIMTVWYIASIADLCHNYSTIE